MRELPGSQTLAAWQSSGHSTHHVPVGTIVRAARAARSGPREDATRIGSAGVIRRQAVDISPLRRVNSAIYLITTGAREASFRNIKTIAECLADELINAAKGSSNRQAHAPACQLALCHTALQHGQDVVLLAGIRAPAVIAKQLARPAAPDACGPAAATRSRRRMRSSVWPRPIAEEWSGRAYLLLAGSWHSCLA